MVPGERDSAVDLISFDYAVAALEELFARRFESGSVSHIAAGRAASLPLQAFLELCAATFRDEVPDWSRRGTEVPPIVPLRTYKQLERTVEQTADVFYSRVMTAMSRFVPQLAYPKVFATERTLKRLSRAGLRPQPLQTWLPAVLRHCVRTGWGRNAAAGEMAEAV